MRSVRTFLARLRALGVGRLLARVLVNADAIDPLMLIAVVVVLVGVGLSACILPVRRALRLDPAIVLRYE